MISSFQFTPQQLHFKAPIRTKFGNDAPSLTIQDAIQHILRQRQTGVRDNVRVVNYFGPPGWGHVARINGGDPNGMTLSMDGIGPHGLQDGNEQLKVGDYILMAAPGHGHWVGGLCRIDEIEYKRNPPDQWFAKVTIIDHAPAGQVLRWMEQAAIA